MRIASGSAAVRRCRRVLLAGALLTAIAVLASSPAPAAFKGKNGRILCQGFTVDWDVLSLLPSGRGLVNLTKAFGPPDNNPAASPDGERIAFDRAGGIWVMNADGSSKRKLTSGDDSNPYFSPDGRRIVFEREFGSGDSEIFVMRANGTGARNLTKSPTTEDHNPVFSPNGRKIAFESFRTPTPVFGNSSNIVTMNADGSSQSKVTGAANMNDFSPDYSPNGRRIVFSRDTDFDFAPDELFTVSSGGIVGSPLVQLTFTPVGAKDERDPAYSPNGKRIVFSAGKGGGVDAGPLFTIRSNGKNRKRVPNTPGRCKAQNWAPAPG